MMSVNKITNVAFKGKIIDSHVHVGDWDGGKYNAASLDVFIKEPLSNNDTIEKVIVSSLTCIDHKLNEIDGNKQIAEIAKSNNKIIPLAVGLPNSGSVDNLEKLFDECPNVFFGLKFHPDSEKLLASSQKFDKYLDFAQKKTLPCLFHCGINYKPNSSEFVDEASQYSAPEHIYTAAKKVPNTPIILAHMGAGGEKVHNLAIKTLIDSIENDNAKLYADISWVDCDNKEKPNIVEVIKKLQSTTKGDKTDRLLFGTDAPIAEFAHGKSDLTGKEYYEKTVIDTKNAIKKNFADADELIDKIFYKNAEKLFLSNKSAKEVPKAVSSLKNKLSKTKLAIAIVASVAAISGTFFLAERCLKKKKLKLAPIIAKQSSQQAPKK